MPMMLIYNTCDQFIRTIPNLVMDETNVEYIDEKGEDHIFDEACHIVMARPLAIDGNKKQLRLVDKRIDELTKIKTTDVDILQFENDQAYREIGFGQMDYDMIDIDDSGRQGMVSTI